MRKFENWLDAYFAYAKDDYCPDPFHYWTGLSVLAGALERKVWCRNGKIVFYPNIYTMLVTFAGVGKSTAISRGTNLLERLKSEVNPEFKIIDEQITEPAFVKAMELRQAFSYSGRELFHSSGFFYASEASSSALQNTCGMFTSTITNFYDCPGAFGKTTLSGGQIRFYNVCFNMLAGATFDYLKTLVNEQSVMGGFASRVLYVVNRERLIRSPKWGASSTADFKMEQDLFEDLSHIHKIVGQFSVTPDFVSAWEKAQPEYDKALAEMNSMKLESLAARKSLSVMKIAMLLSIAEGDSLVLDLPHWEKAVTLVDEVTKDNAFILSQGAMSDKMSQTGVTQFIGQTLKRNGGKMNMKQLKGLSLMSGFSVDSITKTIDHMTNSTWLHYDGSSGNVTLLVDPDRYL